MPATPAAQANEAAGTAMPRTAKNLFTLILYLHRRPAISRVRLKTTLAQLYSMLCVQLACFWLFMTKSGWTGNHLSRNRRPGPNVCFRALTLVDQKSLMKRTAAIPPMTSQGRLHRYRAQ